VTGTSPEQSPRTPVAALSSVFSDQAKDRVVGSSV
jgi:hypothetical protein